MIYLIHFSRPYHHAQHYLGWTDDLNSRIERHRAGHGSPLIRAVTAAGIAWVVAATWNGTRADERRAKAWHNSRQWCPICRRGHLAKKRAWRRHQRATSPADAKPAN